MAADAPVGHDFDTALGQHQIDEDAVVVLGVPHAQFAKPRQCALTYHGLQRCFAPRPPEIAVGQGSFDADHDFAAVPRFARAHPGLQLLGHGRGHRPLGSTLVHPAVSPPACPMGHQRFVHVTISRRHHRPQNHHHRPKKTHRRQTHPIHRSDRLHRHPSRESLRHDHGPGCGAPQHWAGPA